MVPVALPVLYYLTLLVWIVLLIGLITVIIKLLQLQKVFPECECGCHCGAPPTAVTEINTGPDLGIRTYQITERSSGKPVI